MRNILLAIVTLVCCDACFAMNPTIDSLRLDSLLLGDTKHDTVGLCRHWCESVFEVSEYEAPFYSMHEHFKKSVKYSTRTVDKILYSDSEGSWHQLMVEKLVWTENEQLAASKRYARKIKKTYDSLKQDTAIDFLDYSQFPIDLLDIDPSEVLDKYTEAQFRNHIRWRFKLCSKEEEDYLIRRIPELVDCSCTKFLSASAYAQVKRIINAKGIQKRVYESTPVGLPQLK
jgi:hypothetical protein